MSKISEQRREQIVRTAKRIVDKHGPSRLTAEAITQEVGVSRPLLYHYFENMGDLLAAVMDDYVSEFDNALSTWEQSWEGRAIDDFQEWASSFVAAVRPNLADACPLLRGAQADGQTPSAYLSFLNSCTDVLEGRASNEEIDAYAPCRTVDDLSSSLRFALFGLAGVLNKSVETAEAARILATLWKGTWESSSPDPSHRDGEKAAQSPTEEAPSSKKGILGWIFN